MTAETVEDLCRLRGVHRHRALEVNYQRFNHPGFRVSDPVSFVWSFDNDEDRELAAWVASGLAYGRVASILAALRDLNTRWEGSPTLFLQQASLREQQAALRGFVYRWTRPGPLLGYLRGYEFLRQEEAIPNRILESAQRGPCGYRAGVEQLVRDLRAIGEEDPGHLLPDPSGPSACKRLAMWLRWMSRRDHIDPGPWADLLPPDRLWVPLDTHMFRIARRLGMTRRTRPDAEAARRITAAFARIRPDDPLRYDFAITRLGMKVGANE